MPERDNRPNRKGSGNKPDDDWSNRVNKALTGHGHEPERPKRKPRRHGRRLAVFAAVLLGCGGAAFAIGSYLVPVNQAEADTGPGPRQVAQAEEPNAAPAPKPAPKPAVKPTPPPKPAAAPQVGTQKFGDWLLLCQDAAQMTRKTCFVAQQVAEELSKQVVFAWRLQYDDQGQIASVFRTPTGVYVNRGIVLKLGEADEGLKVAYQLCDEKKCQAVANVTPEILKSLSAAKAVSASLALISGKVASVNVSMSGFPAAMAALAKLK